MTNTSEIQERLDAARKREKEARAEAARLRRELVAAERRKEAQRLCVLGRAWETWGERTPAFREQAARFLASYVTRDTDRYALIGSSWELTKPLPHDGIIADGDDHVRE